MEQQQTYEEVKIELENPVGALSTPQPSPELAPRIQDGDLIKNSGFFDHPNCLRAGYTMWNSGWKSGRSVLRQSQEAEMVVQLA